MKNNPSKKTSPSEKQKKEPSQKNKSPDWAGVGFSGKAQICYQDFILKYQALIRESYEIPLAILVWGPGVGGGDLYDKRAQIQEELYRLGHVALFSEEIDKDSNYPELSVRDLEMFQALAAHCIIVIEGSPGSIAEVHDFAGLNNIAHKMLVFIDERAQQGYSYKGVLWELMQRYTDCVETFSYPKDIKECNLLGAVLKKVRKLQITEWRSRSRH